MKAKKARHVAGLSFVFVQGSSRISGRLFLDDHFFAFRRLAAARPFGQRGFDFLDRLGLGDPLDRRNFPGQPVERGFVKLPFAIGLLGLYRNGTDRGQLRQSR